MWNKASYRYGLGRVGTINLENLISFHSSSHFVVLKMNSIINVKFNVLKRFLYHSNLHILLSLRCFVNIYRVSQRLPYLYNRLSDYKLNPRRSAYVNLNPFALTVVKLTINLTIQ